MTWGDVAEMQGRIVIDTGMKMKDERLPRYPYYREIERQLLHAELVKLKARRREIKRALKK